ncbi:cyclic AMP-dependent transcription factor ATF-4 isoform X2 [Poeciliopsis prolifica]|uniref:cyclic AMP-dependent transcription factor ATF-4 isoform X2 n=1 Tax=Poeciliopsis prolifica TaxID=188132 RepID=UPI0024137040|nr:cyclic AMP-dependent transcription factor ATF-4 isoform X2 [Poeciliopsis prolifica]
MTLSQLALEDMEALCFGSSFLMADHMGPLLDQDEEEAFSPSSSFEVKAPASPSLSFSSSYASSTSPYQTMSFSPFSSTSPPASPPLSHPTKPEAELLSLLGASDLLSGHGADDDLGDMEWMSEKIDLSDFDLESLIGSCSTESPSSPEDLLASLDSHMDLDSFDKTVSSLQMSPEPDVPSSLPEAPPVAEDEVVLDQELVLKSKPSSPHPSSSPASPAYTLELGSEVDVLDVEKMSPSVATAIISNSSEVLQTSSPIVLSFPTTHFVVVLSNKDALPNLSHSTAQSSDSESDSGIESAAGSSPSHPSPPNSPVASSSRTKPYCKPEPTSPKTPKIKSVSGAPKVVEKKLKKMEQNKTAATRYRQKKRVEQEQLSSELEDLEKRNNELKEKAESISREIQYLKDLVEEVRKHHRGKTASVA